MNGRWVGRVVTVAAVTFAVVMSLTAGSALGKSRIVFSRNGDLSTVRPDGTGFRHITGSPPREHTPAWSPDRRRIAFVAWDRRILVIDANGEHRRLLVRLPSRIDEVTGLAWSPDGRRIAFSTARFRRVPAGVEDCGQIWWMWSDGRNPHRIVWDEPHITGISWSPTGEWLAVGFEHQNMTVACGDDRPQGIARVRPDGSGLHGLGARAATDPDWSPEGRWIAYRDWRRTCHACGEIWLIQPDGSHNHPIMSERTPGGGYRDPRYSPGGRRFAAIGEGLWVLTADGRPIRRIVGNVDSIDW